MTAALNRPLPKFIAPNEGESFQLLTHTVVSKVNGGDTNGKYAMFEVTDTAENSVPLHSHPWDETFYILEGEVSVRVGEESQITTVGSVVRIPANTAHTFKIHSTIARILVIIAPAAAEAFYREMAAEVTSLPQDFPVLERIFAKHNARLH